MPKFSVCIETIFNQLPVPDRITESAACGAAAVEFWTWRDKDLDGIVRAKEASGVLVATFGALDDASPNDPATGEQALRELLLAIDTARQIGALGLTLHSGPQLPSAPREKQLRSIAALLAAAAPAAEKAHITLLLEPRNARIDWPGNLLTSTADACRIVDLVSRPNVKLLFDVYHQYVTEGSVLASIETHIARIGHFHIADVPGRHEPGTGAVDFVELFKLIDSLGYAGHVGLEFLPSADHADAVKRTIHLT